MASLYKPKNSPFWWIKFRDTRTNKICRQSTRLRVGVGADTRKANELRGQKIMDENRVLSGTKGQWDSWVTDFINDQVAGRTRERYLTAWRTLRMWLREIDVIAPREVTYENCSGYLKWRTVADIRNGKYNAGKNTAILEFKIFRWIMREAVKRSYASGNPAREVVLKHEPRKLFPDYSDEQLQNIYTAIKTEPEPDRTCFLRSFALSMFHGARLNETNVNPMTDVQLKGEIPTIRFLQKGGRERIKPLHPQLVPLFRRLQAAKETATYPMDQAGARLRWGNRWTKFFLRHGLKAADPNACFHSLRITVENVLREAGIEQRVREFYLSHEHGNADVNARYDRVKVREMLACHAPLNRPWLEL
jgi:integrase